MSTAEKSTELATGAELVGPILGIPGLPDHITDFAMKIDGKGSVEISCSFLVEKGQLEQMQRAWQPMFAKYRLVKHEDSPSA